ncbi:phage tail assembly protein [bacterium]|nr:phage tail assembly protein [bacterium]
MSEDQMQRDMEALDQKTDAGKGEDRDDLVTYPFQDADGKNLSVDEAKEAAEEGSLHLPLIYSLRYPVEIRGKTNNKALKTLEEVKIHHRLSGKALREGMNLGKTGDQTAYFIGAATGLQQYELDQLDGYDYFQLTKVVNGFLPGGNESEGDW